MAFEALMTEINILLSRIAEQPGDKEQLEVVIREKLNEMRAFGMPLPQDLVDLEAALDQQSTEEEIERGRRSKAEG